jgi:hypothetical protein
MWFRWAGAALPRFRLADRELLTADDDLAGTRAVVAVFRALGGAWQ